MNGTRKAGDNCAQSVPPDTERLLRVAAVQLPHLDPEDRAVLRPYVERDMAALTHHMTD